MLGHIYSFMDIPMLGAMAQIHRGVLSQFATSDSPCWGRLVHERFQIAIHTKPSKTFGGKDWKDAYRIMHLCHRMPKSRWTNRKAIFAKGSSSPAALSVWVTLNHTENCRTRILRSNNNNSNNNNHHRPPRGARRRYVDLWVCLQNVRSAGPPVHVDILQSELHFVGGLGSLHVENCLREQMSCGYRWLVPKMLHKHNHPPSSSSHAKAAVPPNTLNDLSSSHGITLNPMEFCIVSIPFACGHDAFETDVLARTVALRVPFSYQNQHDKKEQVSATDIRKKKNQEAQAWFVPEGDVWDHYCELPGGCLTLSDRERRFHMML